MNKKIILTIFLSVVAFFISAAITNKILNTDIIPFGICKDCNVILISIDTLRAKSLPCYGYEKNTAPTLCDFAKKSFLFTNSYSQSAYTLDSHFSIFTSTYPSVHNMTIPFISVLSDEIKTIPEILKQKGYFNLYSGAMPDANLPLDKGLGRSFDESRNAFTPKKWEEAIERNIKGQKFFAFLHTYFVHDPYFPEETGVKLFYDKPIKNFTSREEICRKALDLIKENGIKNNFKLNIKKNDSDYCDLYFQYNDLAVKAEDPKVWQFNQKAFNNAYWNLFNSIDNLEKKELLKSLYETRIHELDIQIKSFIDYLDKRDYFKNTIIIITSDHGEAFFEHQTWTHSANLYQEVIRVPLIVYVPNSKPQVIKKLVQGMDIFPTILYLLGIKDNLFEKQFAGNNLFSIKDKEYIISQHFADRKIAVINKEWKLIINNDKKNKRVIRELYNLINDPEERKNIIKDNKNTAEKMELFLKRELSQQKIYSSIKEPFPTWIDEEQRKKLIETGYF